jgi:flagella basal body P-ring formation protein FlgA
VIGVILLCAAVAASAATDRAARSDRTAGEPSMTVSLRAESNVRGPEIRLGDIAEIHGRDGGQVDRLRAIEVARAPLPGLTRTLDAAYLKARLRLANVDLATLALDVPSVISVTTASQQVSGADLVAAAREYLLATRSEEATRLSIQPTGAAPPKLIVPAGQLELKVRTRSGAEAGLGTVSVTVEAWVDGTLARSLSVPVRVGLQSEVVVAARPITRGGLLDAEDVRVERRELIAGQDPVRVVDAVLGLRAVRGIAVGEPIQMSLVEQPPLVRRGDIVLLTTEGRGLRAVTQGEAKEDGKEGQVIRVRNLHSNREVYGQVDAERSVRVPF